MAKTTKSLSVVDVTEDGNIYIESGYKGNKITQLGSGVNNSKVFTPYAFVQYKTYKIFSPYHITQKDVPASFESVDKFKDALRSQANGNQFIEKWVRLGSESMRQWLKSKVNTSDVRFVLLDNNSNLSTAFYSTLNTKGQVFQLPTFDINSVESLTVEEDLPEDVKNRYIGIEQNLQREDVEFKIQDLKFDDSELFYFNGFVDFSAFDAEPLKNKFVILVTDFADVSHVVAEATRNLQKMGVNVIFTFVLSKLN